MASLALLTAPLPEPARGQAAPGAPAQPLTLEAVLESVDAHYPLLAAARVARDVAAGSLRSALGGFDTKVVGEGELNELGFYDNRYGEGRVEQNTRLWGARFFGGYRLGQGDFPSYYGDRQTDRRGEVSGGFELPLLRGRGIDDARARLRRAEIDVQRAEPEIELERIGFLREATLAYWRWLAGGLRVDVTRRLLGEAEERQEQLSKRVARGVVPRIDLVDNERLIVDRRMRLLGAQRDAEQAAISLSLFLRDDNGAPRIPGPETLPADFPPEKPPQPDELGADLERARRAHPLLRRFALERERVDVAFELARNDRLPSLDLFVEGSRDAGSSVKGISSEGSISPDPKSQTEIRARLRFELPVQRREALGRMAVAKAEIDRIERRERFARERIEAEIRRALTGVEAAFAQTSAARENLELAEELRVAEERKLMLGTSNLIDVNIREIQAADAAVALIRTQAEFFRALVDYRAAVAVDF